MLVAGFASATFATNVYVVAPAAGEECVVVDPGIGVSDGVDDLLREHRLEPVAVILTHGHIDHTFSVVPVGTARGLPAYIHGDDRELLRDPMKGISPETAAMFGGRLTWVEPADVRLISDEPLPARRHADQDRSCARSHPRSVMFGFPECPDTITGSAIPADAARWSPATCSLPVPSGRTTFPGGSHEQMLHSLAEKVLPLPDDVLVLPGQGRHHCGAGALIKSLLGNS